MKLLPLSFLIPLFVVLGTPVSAQTTVSLMGGLNSATLDWDGDVVPASVYLPVKRMSVGLAATFPVSGQFGIQLGGTYSQKGGNLDVERMLESVGDMAIAIAGANKKMDYLELALLARMGSPLLGERASGHLLAGPVLAWQTSCRFQDSLGNSYRCDNVAFDPKKYDVGVAGGGGIEIGLTGTLDASVGLLYTLGLLNISNEASREVLTVKNRAMTLRAGLAYRIG